MVGRGKKKEQQNETVLEWFDEELQKYIHHPLAYYFERWTAKLRDRAIFAFVLSFIISIFSKVQPICIAEKCYRYYIELLTNPGLLLKPFSIYIIHQPFITTLAFFFIIWMVLLTAGHWVQKQRWINRLVIPILIFAIFIYFIFATSGMIRPFMLESGAAECTVPSDCVRAGYCGEVCASVYRPIYTTYSEDCHPLQSCGCLDYKCVGS